MSTWDEPSKTSRGRGAAAVLLVVGMALGEPPAAAAQKDQPERRAVVQIEVSDSLGLPLPDAKIDVFTFLEGGTFWEWVPVGSAGLAAGITLLRFSNPGYRSAVFSVPAREGGTMSLRVRLQPGDDSAKSPRIEAHAVQAIGLAIEGHAHTDVIGRRRVIEHPSFENQAVNRFGPMMQRARNTELTVIPVSGGSFSVYGRSSSGSRCPMQVMVNGDRRRVLPFETFDQMYAPGDAEAIEIFPAGTSIPLAYQVQRGGCGLMIVWFRAV